MTCGKYARPVAVADLPPKPARWRYPGREFFFVLSNFPYLVHAKSL
jgi:hypothetical protein